MTSLAEMLRMGESNSRERCPANGCTKTRQGVARYCQAHHVRKVRYGDPHGRPIPQKEYLAELREVRAFFDTHSDHPALASANHYFQNWLDKAKANEAPVGQSIFGKLYREGIEPQAILTEIMAIWLYSDKHPNALPDDLRLTFCLARNVARLGTFQQSRTKTGRIR